ncbi:MAG TPA: glycosyltransferase 87 family protein [Cyclobacteriaceae bacterium]
MARHRPLYYLLTIISISAYSIMGYGIQRYETAYLFGIYFTLFAIYAWVLNDSTTKEINYWLAVSIILRVILLFSIPALSDDFYRFIWDGRLLASGIQPFTHLPGYYLEQGNAVDGVNQFLYDHLNSKEYFTVYPPLAQIIFWFSAILFPDSILGSVVVMRILVLAAELGSLMLIKKLLPIFGLAPKNILIYALNPLVILELTGNLHFEAFIIFFLLLAIYFIYRSKIWQAGVTIGLSIGAKLLPLIFLPLFIIRMGIRRSVILYVAAAITIVFLFAPLLNAEVINGFSQSLGLYFKRFEFNASIYYLVREYGFYTKGYNTIQTVGWKLGVIAMVGILIISFWPFSFTRHEGKWKLTKKRSGSVNAWDEIPIAMMWVLFFYFLMTTTLHPWYLTTLLMLSIFTPYRFVIIWTAAVFLTYAGYTENGFYENGYLVVIEYILVIGYLVYEWIWRRRYTYQ